MLYLLTANHPLEDLIEKPIAIFEDLSDAFRYGNSVWGEDSFNVYNIPVVHAEKQKAESVKTEKLSTEQPKS